MSDEDILFTDHKGYRHILVGNNSESGGGRTSFYSLNLEHAQSEANGEFRNASQVNVFGFKKEGSTVSLWIRDSSDINLYGSPHGSYTALQNMSQYPADFDHYTPSLYRIERSNPFKFVGLGGSDGCGQGKPGPDQKCKGVVPCHNYPTSTADLVQGKFPEVDWGVLKTSLWQPWCGYIYPGAIQVLEADSVGHETVATTSPGAVYMRGHPKPTPN